MKRKLISVMLALTIMLSLTGTAYGADTKTVVTFFDAVEITNVVRGYGFHYDSYEDTLISYDDGFYDENFDMFKTDELLGITEKKPTPSEYIYSLYIAKAFDIGVTWDGAVNAISIDTSKGYVED